MKFVKEKISQKTPLTASAEVANDHLVLSLPNAIEPIIWRMELNKIGTATFEIKKSDKNETFSLILKPKKGTAESIASFDNKDGALDALLKTSTALQGSNTKHPAIAETDGTSSPPPEKQTNNKRKWLYLLLGMIAVIALYVYLGNQMPERINDFEAVTSAKSPTSSSPDDDAVGVPLSADDYFKGMQ